MSNFDEIMEGLRAAADNPVSSASRKELFEALMAATHRVITKDGKEGYTNPNDLAAAGTAYMLHLIWCAAKSHHELGEPVTASNLEKFLSEIIATLAVSGAQLIDDLRREGVLQDTTH